jgi:predicted NUDIX family NTP pyrophosphohydrolase
MPARSAGLLVYRLAGGHDVELLLVHPGGPFWAKKDEGAWSIPKGEHDPEDDPLDAAEREYREEIGQDPPHGPRVFLGEVTQSGGKRVSAWAVEGDVDTSAGTSNTFELEWPRGSGVVRTYPEVDRVEWTPLATARVRLLAGQRPLLDRLLDALSPSDGPTVSEGDDRPPPP